MTLRSIELTILFAASVFLCGCEARPETPMVATPEPQPSATARAPAAAETIAQITDAKAKSAVSVAIPAVRSLADSQIGKLLNQHDQILARSAESEVLTKGGSTTWNNPDSGTHGEVNMVRSYRNNGKDCRDLNHTVYVRDRQDMVKITACKGVGSSWSGSSML